MILNGSGQVTAAPDLAILRLGVVTTGENLTLKQAENARLSQAILKALERLGVTDIQTYEYTINKNYEYENGNRLDKGYMIRNILEIRSNNMELVGELIDTSLYYGANTVDSLHFEVSDSSHYYLEALNLAIMNAYEKAKSITEKLNITLNPIPKQINETSTSVSPSRAYNMKEGAAFTPIETGNLFIQASVITEFMYQDF